MSAKRGSALLAVLWVIALLSFLLVTTMMIVMQGVESSNSRELVFHARLLAEAGMAVGTHPVITKPTDAVLHHQFSTVEGYDVLITSEEARLNINAMLTEDNKAILQRLFTMWGLDAPDAETVVDCLMDWVDSDDLKRPRGAEKGDYEEAGFADRPFNRPFISVDEMSLVQGMDMVTRVHPNWRISFTVWGSGALDINEAAPDLIAAVANVPLAPAQTLVANRNGPDGVPHTKDDVPIEDLGAALFALGAPGQNLPNLFTLNGSVLRIQSVGHVGNYRRGIAATVRQTGQRPIILQWAEFVP